MVDAEDEEEKEEKKKRRRSRPRRSSPNGRRPSKSPASQGTLTLSFGRPSQPELNTAVF
jgi:hypothetical protein